MVKFLFENWRKYKQNLLKEGGFSRLRQIMLGQVPSIDQVGILTAENPRGEPLPPEQNKALMKQLKGALQNIRAGYTEIRGSFGDPEKSVFIMNISRDDTAKLGEEFEQDAVIWGLKMRGDNDDPFFRFQYIEGHDTIQTRDVSLGSGDVDDIEDYYSEKDKRKFIIPFFDSEREDLPSGDYEQAKFMQGGRRISFESDEIPDEKEAQKLAESIKKRSKKLLEKNRTKKSKWHHRNLMKEEIKRLDSIINLSS